jgi:hypothetical protein
LQQVFSNFLIFLLQSRELAIFSTQVIHRLVTENRDGSFVILIEVCIICWDPLLIPIIMCLCRNVDYDMISCIWQSYYHATDCYFDSYYAGIDAAV